MKLFNFAFAFVVALPCAAFAAGGGGGGGDGRGGGSVGECWRRQQPHNRDWEGCWIDAGAAGAVAAVTGFRMDQLSLAV
jgi:hypothetical protein